jgi:hypothetical protein
VTAEIVARAPDILASLLRIVESKPLDFYLKYPNKSSRPLLPVALADVFGANLPEVTGAGLTELFGNIAVYCKRFAQADEDKPKGRKKDGIETTLFPVHRMSHMIDVMGRQEGSRNFFRQHDSPRKIQLRIQQELPGRTKKYIRAMVEGTWYAFKIIPKTNNFIFVEELEYRTKLELGPDEEGAMLQAVNQDGEEDDSDTTQGADKDNAPADHALPARSAGSIVPRAKRKGPIRFSGDALREDRADGEVVDATEVR